MITIKDIVFEFIDKFGLLAILFSIFLEYGCFPLPSEVILPLAGGYCFNKCFPLIYMFFLSVLVSIIGSLICFILGRVFGQKFINIFIKIFPKSKKGIEKTKDNYEKYSSLSVLVFRIVPICRTYISFVAGISKISLIKFILFSTIGIAIWNSALIYLGFKFSKNLDIIASFYSRYKNFIIIIVLILIFFFITFYFVKRNLKKDAK